MGIVDYGSRGRGLGEGGYVVFSVTSTWDLVDF